ncbi:hypothetical protein N7492_002569 [Penicillium capsulatum]|uniref:Uncharacterized protein n=1 Tax=Penicillium capsulatum TaxID=69766 RepID=A0A9W9IKA5_9EURO|nr:hypothetical protein N7492_002569 [Penicillium capsulatum]KAJ6122828.1 hypothetical protein N7512_005293 [Penicillium capsulatum]
MEKKFADRLSDKPSEESLQPILLSDMDDDAGDYSNTQSSVQSAMTTDLDAFDLLTELVPKQQKRIRDELVADYSTLVGKYQALEEQSRAKLRRSEF